MPVAKYGSTPISQKARPLGLFISGAGGGAIGGGLTLPGGMAWGHIFYLRPEEVIYHYPTRATVIQTLGGAWVDDFGEGLTDITLTGHTGWHDEVGGETAFLELRNGVFVTYHAMRMAAAAGGSDPDSVQMLFIDTLHSTSYIVYPISLQTRKHRSRPLLFQYQLRLIGLDRLA